MTNKFIFGIVAVFLSLKISANVFSETIPLKFPTVIGEIHLDHHLTLDKCSGLSGLDSPELGNIWRLKIDLGANRPKNVPSKFKGLFALAFSVGDILKQNNFLYFNSREQREKIRNILFKRYEECRNFENPIVIKDVTNFGNIPSGELENNSQVIDGNLKVAHLTGPQSFFERLRSVRNAKKSIYVQSLVFRGDLPGIYLADEIIKKRIEGLDVKVMVDMVSEALFDPVDNSIDKKNSWRMVSNMAAAGIRVFGFSCKGAIVNEFKGLDGEKLLRRNHEKMWIIDGELGSESESSLAILGGINIAQDYFALSGKSKHSWRDQDISIKGDIVPVIQKGFLRNFIDKGLKYKTGRFDSKCFNPFDPIKEKKKFLKFKKEHTQTYLEHKNDEFIEWQKVYQNNINLILNNQESNFIQYNQIKRARFVLSRPEEGENSSYEAYINVINNAKKSIEIANAFLIPPLELKEALKKALLRGVKIRFLSHSVETNKLPVMTLVGRSNYLDIYNYLNEDLDSFCKVDNRPSFYEWRGHTDDDLEITYGRIHTKYMIVDDLVGIVGSHNLGYSSQKNAETLLIFEGSTAATLLRQQFDKDIKYGKKASEDDLIRYKFPRTNADKLKLKFGKLLEIFL